MKASQHTALMIDTAHIDANAALDRLQERVQALELQNRRIRRGLTVVCIALGLPIAFGFSRLGTEQCIRARRFEVVGENGDVQVALKSRSAATGGILQVNDAAGIPRVEMAADLRGAYLTLGESVSEGKRTSSVSLAASNLGAYVLAVDDSKSSIEVGVQREVGYVRSSNSKGKAVATWPSKGNAVR